jgi:hypothetical protein
MSKVLSSVIMREYRKITTSYLAELAGVSVQTVRENVRLLRLLAGEREGQK